MNYNLDPYEHMRRQQDLWNKNMRDHFEQDKIDKQIEKDKEKTDQRWHDVRMMLFGAVISALVVKLFDYFLG